jgi:hypothetical protein
VKRREGASAQAAEGNAVRAACSIGDLQRVASHRCQFEVNTPMEGMEGPSSRSV